MAARKSQTKVTELPVNEFGDLVRRIRKGGLTKPCALFAIPERGVTKININSSRYDDYRDQYGEHFVGIYDCRITAGALEDDLYHAGVRLTEQA